MKKKKHFLQLNNRGSSLVVVLVMVSFIMILTVISATSALTNYKMKVMNRRNTKNFYTAEEAADELYAVLGKLSSQCFDDAFQEQLAHVTTVTGGTPSLSENTNYNKNLRQNYIKNVLGSFYNEDRYSIGTSDGTLVLGEASGEDSKAQIFAKKLNEYLGYDSNSNLGIERVSDVQVEYPVSAENQPLRNYKVIFKDCVIAYKDSAEGYFSYITLDGEISMPDTLVSFVPDNTQGLTSFTRFSLIGNSGVTVDQCNAQIWGDIFAGSAGGLNISNSDSANNRTNQIRFTDNILITPGDVNIENNVRIQNFNTAFWANNLNVNGDGAVFNTNDFCVLNINDDLNVNGDNAYVTLAGEYHGYGYTDAGSSTHNANSSILMNSYNSHITFASGSNIVVAGHAFIDYAHKILYSIKSNKYTKELYTSIGDSGVSSDSFYEMNEGLSYAGLQELYVVPTYLMNANGTPNTGYITEKGFFAYDLLTNQKVKSPIRVGDKLYYYFDFKDTTAMETYVQRIMEDDAFQTYLNAGNYSDTEKQELTTQRNYMKNLVQANLKELKSTVESDTSNIYMNGSMVLASQADSDLTLNVLGKKAYSYQGGSYDQLKTDLGKKFKSLRCTLLEDYTLDGFTENDIFNNFIDETSFKNLVKDHAYEKDQNGSILLATDADVVIGDSLKEGEAAILVTADSGVIVATGNVRVEKSFSGTIIAGAFKGDTGKNNKGYIEVKTDGDVTIKNSIDGTSVERLITGDDDYKQIFKPYKNQATISNGSVSIEEMKYTDLVKFSSWRKSSN